MGGLVLSGFINDHNSLAFLSVVVGEGGGVSVVTFGILRYSDWNLLLWSENDNIIESYSETLSCV